MLRGVPPAATRGHKPSDAPTAGPEYRHAPEGAPRPRTAVAFAGTGKTSLCKALAHKLAIRLGSRYPSAQLIEINAHSLFSRWFSESGKLVHRLFAHIGELVSDEDSLIFLLIDEVESLTSARKAAVSGSEPSDAVRVVNAVLTAIDSFRTHKNVLLLTTSNVSEAIDVAFVDR